MVLLKFVQSHSITAQHSTRTDRQLADYSIDQSMALPPSASCLHESHAVDVAARRRRGISWYLSRGVTVCNLHCSGVTAAWHAMLIMLHRVTGGPTMSCSLEIWCPVYGHAAQRRWWYTLQYCSQGNSRASTDRGLLTHYMRGGAFDGAFKAFRASWYTFMVVLIHRC